jgi:hypothetical protein
MTKEKLKRMLKYVALGLVIILILILTEAETQALVDGLKQTLANDPPIERQEGPRR